MRGACVAVFHLLSVAVIFFPAAAFARSSESSSPFRTDFTLQRVYEVASERGGKSDVETVPTVRIEGRIHGVGFVDARFGIRRNKTWSASMRRLGAESRDEVNPVLLQGALAAGGGWQKSGERMYPVAASIIGKELKVSFPGRAKGSRKTWQRIYTIKMTLDGSIVVRARISSIPRSAVRRGACGAPSNSASLSESVVPHAHTHGENGAEASETIPPIGTNEEPQGTTLARVVTISTDADAEWYQKYGEQSNAVIASILNIAEAVYNRQLGLRFRIVKQHVYTDASPYVTTDPGLLLSAFTRNNENATNLAVEPSSFQQDVDLKHLFTGKDLDSSVIGIAYIGVVCAVPSLSYGITQSFMEVADPGIFAHELGHNFGAGHDSSTRDGLMFPSISIPPAQKFSEVSLGEITSHLSKYGSCVSLEQMAPRPDLNPPGADPNYPFKPPLSAASLTLKRTTVGDRNDPIIRLSGSLVSQGGGPIGAVGISLLVAGEKVGSAVTAADGTFNFFVRIVLPRGQKIYVYVETEGGEVFSNFVWLGRTVNSQPPRRRSDKRQRR